MMKKRGETHIDWVISLGIFIVFILLLLVWIKPGYEPKYEEETLIDVIKNGIENDFTWEVSKTLLEISGCSAATGAFTFTLNEKLPGLNKLKVLKYDNGELIGYKGKLTVEIYKLGDNDYWIISSKYPYGENPGTSWEGTPLTCSSVEVGEPIVKKGLESDSLSGLSGKVNGWGFPNGRQFKIMLDKLDGSEIKCYDKSGSVNCDTFQPETNIAVKSAEWRYNILDKDHNYSPVMINILVW